jgi:hypothetical protein
LKTQLVYGIAGEYVTTAYKLEVGHPPGAPLFMMIGRLFSFFAAPENVAVCINRVSALSSSLSILFMFWSITLLAKKMALKGKKELTNGEIVAILGSGVVGALAYTFSDSFWFSAVEGEVYAMASLFTAIIFWAILKWDEEMALMQHGELGCRLFSKQMVDFDYVFVRIGNWGPFIRYFGGSSDWFCHLF